MRINITLAAHFARLPDQSSFFKGKLDGRVSATRGWTDARRHTVAGSDCSAPYRVIRSPLPLEGRLARQARTSRKS
jgi:hypothetical protein